MHFIHLIFFFIFHIFSSFYFAFVDLAAGVGAVGRRLNFVRCSTLFFPCSVPLEYLAQMNYIYDSRCISSAHTAAHKMIVFLFPF